MRVYQRYFRIGDAETLVAIDRLFSVRDQYNKAIHAIKDEIGAESVYQNQSTKHLVGFGFSEQPSLSLYREVRNGIFYPKKGSKFGKQLCKKIDALHKPASFKSVLKHTSFGEIIVGDRIYFSAPFGSEKSGWFAQVPWQDVPQSELEQYKKDRAAGTHRNMTLDHLLWTPPAEWVEVKESDVAEFLHDKGKEQNDTK